MEPAEDLDKMFEKFEKKAQKVLDSKSLEAAMRLHEEFSDKLMLIRSLLNSSGSAIHIQKVHLCFSESYTPTNFALSQDSESDFLTVSQENDSIFIKVSGYSDVVEQLVNTGSDSNGKKFLDFIWSQTKELKVSCDGFGSLVHSSLHRFFSGCPEPPSNISGVSFDLFQTCSDKILPQVLNSVFPDKDQLQSLEIVIMDCREAPQWSTGFLEKLARKCQMLERFEMQVSNPEDIDIGFAVLSANEKKLKHLKIVHAIGSEKWDAEPLNWAFSLVSQNKMALESLELAVYGPPGSLTKATITLPPLTLRSFHLELAYAVVLISGEVSADSQSFKGVSCFGNVSDFKINARKVELNCMNSLVPKMSFTPLLEEASLRLVGNIDFGSLHLIKEGLVTMKNTKLVSVELVRQKIDKTEWDGIQTLVEYNNPNGKITIIFSDCDFAELVLKPQ